MKTYPKEELECDFIQVKTRLDKLHIFMNSKAYKYMNPEYKAVLLNQERGMGIYVNALERRIELNKPIKFKL